MKTKICSLLLLLCLTLTACQEEKDHYYTEARIVLQMPSGIVVNQLQGTLTLQNLNSQQTQSTADLTDGVFVVEVLRGAYKADVEGMIGYTDDTGVPQIKHFRAHSDYVALSDEPYSEVELTITLLQ